MNARIGELQHEVDILRTIFHADDATVDSYDSPGDAEDDLPLLESEEDEDEQIGRAHV